MTMVLTVESFGSDRFRGTCLPNPRAVVFGGHAAGQALVAGSHTVDPDRVVHALHATLFNQGDPAQPVEYQVERLRDGRSYAARSVTARQGTRLLLQMTISFALPEPGFQHQDPVPDAPAPHDCPVTYAHPMQVRAVRWDASAGDRMADQLLWARSADPLPDDPHVHAAAIVFVSDMMMGWSPWKAHGIHEVEPGMFAANLDHSLWFHQPFRADEWLLLHQRSPAASGGRSLGTAQVYTASGVLVATVAQESVMRHLRTE